MERVRGIKPGPKPKLKDPRAYGKVFLSVEEAAECFGESRAVLYKMLAQNQIKHLKSGTRYLIPTWAVEQLVTGYEHGYMFGPVKETKEYSGDAS